MVRVFPDLSSGWLVELGSGEQPFSLPTKAQAIWFAIAWAENHAPCQVRVYGSLGELERSLAFPNGGHRRWPSSDRRKKQIEIGFPDRRRQARRAQVE
jgi:hypothetical protein